MIARTNGARMWALPLAAALAAGWVGERARAQDRGPAQVVSKSCGACGAAVPLAARVGDTCPACGVRWGQIQEQVVAPAEAPRDESGFRSFTPEPAAVRSPAGRWELAALDGRHVRVAAVGSGDPLAMDFLHCGAVSPHMFGLGDTALVTVDAAGTARVYSLPEGLRISRPMGRRSWGAAFTSDDLVMLASARSVSLRNPRTGKPTGRNVKPCAGHYFTSATLAPDGHTLRTVEDNEHIIQWDLRTGRLLGYPGHDGANETETLRNAPPPAGAAPDAAGPERGRTARGG